MTQSRSSVATHKHKSTKPAPDHQEAKTYRSEELGSSSTSYGNVNIPAPITVVILFATVALWGGVGGSPQNRQATTSKLAKMSEQAQGGEITS